jgi:glycosyltransferase involved in cell wall biosynthesis
MNEVRPPVDVCDHRLMIFTPYSRGHHGGYVRSLLEGWLARRLPGTLDFVVDDRFPEVHADVVALAEPYRERVRFIALSEAEVDSIRTNSSERPTLMEFLRQGLRTMPHVEREWNLMCRYAEQCGASHLLVQYMNQTVLGLAAGLPAPCPVSGIYHDLILQEAGAPAAKAETHLPQKFVWKRILRHPQLHTLFVLDMFSLPSLQAFNEASVVYLPAVADLPDLAGGCAADENTAGEVKARLRAEWGIEPGRTVFLLLGSLDDRKGVPQTLEALAVLPPELAQRSALVIAGKPRRSLAAVLDSALAAARRHTVAQIVTRFEYLPESTVAECFHMSDVIMLPYQRFAATSGVLTQAALLGRPVIASDFGWIGRAARHFRLGLTVDTTQPAEIASAMGRYLQEPVDSLYDRASMEQLARQCHPKQFCTLIFSAIYGGDV